MSIGAGQLLGEVSPGRIPGFINEIDRHDTVGEAECGLDRVGESGEDLGAGDEAVYDDRDVVLELLLELGWIAELHGFAVNDGARIAAGRQLAKEVDKLTLLLRDDRTHDLISGARLKRHELVGDLLHGLSLDALVADRAVRDADARPQQPHVVVNFGDRADGGARVAVGRLLVDRHGRAEALDEVDVGAVDLPEKLTSVGGERLDVSTLSLREDRVECERGLPGARKPREHHE